LLQANLPEAKGQARDQVAKAVGVSGRTIDFATRVLKQGTPELVQAVEQGNLSVNAAWPIAKLPSDEQPAALREALQPRPSTKINGAGSDEAPVWARGPSPQERAKKDPGRRWCESLHKLSVLLTSVRDQGGIGALAGTWGEASRADGTAELRRIAGEIEKWIKILEETKHAKTHHANGQGALRRGPRHARVADGR
jgi:hypothetical protein